MSSLITVWTNPGGLEHGLLATVISKEEYMLVEIEGKDYKYMDPTPTKMAQRMHEVSKQIKA